MSDITCPYCRTIVPDPAYFCQNCGRILKPKPESTSIGRQIFIYLVSFFLAPFGIFFAFYYLKQPNKKSKIIGTISLILTAIALYIGYAAIKGYFRTIYGDLLP